jgi:hypothetical protein
MCSTLTPKSVIPYVTELQNTIDEYGHDYKGTREVIGTRMEIAVTHIDTTDDTEIMAYYGDDFAKRLEDELYHYRQIQYSLLHKVKETAYFFKGQWTDSRKIITFSNDCISSVQYMARDHRSFLIVHMRSSDVRNLLPLDLHWLAKIQKAIDNIYETGVEEQTMIVTIGSAHYYLNGGRSNDQ